MFLTGTCVCFSLEHVYVSHWNMCMFLTGTCVCFSLEHVYVSHWNMCMFLTGDCSSCQTATEREVD